MPEALLQVVLPSMGESVTQGTVTGIRKAAGESIAAGETLIDVTTDKVDVEIPSPEAGRIVKILVKDGDTIEVGALLAEIQTASSDASPNPSTKIEAPQSAPGSTVVEMPSIGQALKRGVVRAWHKAAGDLVERDEVIVEVDADGSPIEIPSPVSGRLMCIVAGPGASVEIGAPLCEIGPADAPAPATEPPPAKVAPSAPPAAEPSKTGSDGAPSPLARRAAALAGTDIASIKGTGPGGAVRKSDVEVVAARIAPAAPPAPPAPTAAQPAAPTAPPVAPAAPPTAPTSPPANRDGRAPVGASPLKGPAAALAAAMEQSLGVPTATSFRTFAVGALESRRLDLNAALKTAGRSEKISFTHLIAFALARSAREMPAMTASFHRSETGPERVAGGVQLGLAVDLQRKDGSRLLVVPVIRDAGELDFVAFHAAYESLVAKARSGKLMPDEFTGATITLTNPGAIGTVASVPRLLAGQGTIIAAGAIGYPPGFSSSHESLATFGVSKIMTLTSTYDHRVIQGAESGEFLRRIEQLLGGADGFYEQIASSLGVAVPQEKAAAAPAPQQNAPTAAQGPGQDLITAAAAGMALISRIRTHGHTAASLDPLEGARNGDPVLDPSTLQLDNAVAERIPAAAIRTYAPGNNLREVLDNLRAIYCSTIAYEVEHITSHEQRSWLRKQIESGAHVKPLTRERKLELLDRLTRVEAFERYLRKTFLGQKTFSIEGIDALVPMLEELLHLLVDDGVQKVEIGTAHRGRLSLITHVLDKPYEDVLVEFEQAELRGVESQGDVTGDVKYHQGARGTYATASGASIEVVLANNPSHLEAVDGVVVGRTRADQTDRTKPIAVTDSTKALALLVHGDAAFTGQGVVAEVLNMQALRGYSVGGTMHVIANNQIGFTTEPSDERSTRYASDLAKSTDMPIVHVNADDIEACIGAMTLAAEFRKKFARDVLIDLIGYRRFGHNEADEPAYTQPLMYEKIAHHLTVRELFAKRLFDEGIVTAEDVKKRYDAAYARVAEAHANVKKRIKESAGADAAKRPANGQVATSPDTRVAADVLSSLNRQLLVVPDGFTVHPKLATQLGRRASALDAGGEIDWANAEALAFASLLVQGVPIRLTGQDTERGTFSHRHLVLHDAKTDARYVPMQHLAGARASFEVYNSPLSEYAILGFEYGYSTAATGALVLWEAQFGDFVNGAQIIIDQFISAGMAKWGQTSRLTLLLPHGYEGAGPEHSSARLERFLQLASDGNIRIANCTTPAQYFHLLRDQALAAKARPLVVMTPKSLLRMKVATSQAADLTDGSLQAIIDDPLVTNRKGIKRIILCSGKIYYDLMAGVKRLAPKGLAIARLEMLEPFPLDAVMSLIKSYPDLDRLTWVQEEPRNMGARAFVSRRIRERLAPLGIALDYEGRPDRASPSEGYPGAHAVEQERIVTAALGPRRASGSQT